MSLSLLDLPAAPAFLPQAGAASFPASPCALSRERVEDIVLHASPFHFHFQPIVDLQHGTTVGFEALARFSVSGQRIAPNLVFAAASSFGLRVALEALVFARAVAARQLLPANCFLTVNVGPEFLLSDDFDRILAHTPSLNGVIVEITEDEAISDYTAILRKLDLIRARGGSAAVDDAGSGYASLKHIMEIRPNFIKLDRTFVEGCNSDPAKTVLIDIIGKAANRLDSWIIAEGIETPAELDELIRLTVPLGQGFYLGRPAPSMLLLDRQKAASILERVERLTPVTGLHRSVERCLTASTLGEAERKLRQDPSHRLAVVLDSSNNPVEVLECHHLVGTRSLTHFMKTQGDSEAAEVLRRALTRPPHMLYDPIIVINELGEFQGYVPLDRLIRESLGCD